MQSFIEEHFPDGEIFASLSSYLLQMGQHFGAQVRGFQDRHFKLYNIGIQIRRKKCGADEQELFCQYEPTVMQYCQVGVTAHADRKGTSFHACLHACIRLVLVNIFYLHDHFGKVPWHIICQYLGIKQRYMPLGHQWGHAAMIFHVVMRTVTCVPRLS